MQVDEAVNFNHHAANNSIMPMRQGSPEYRMAPLDGIVTHISSRSGKKRRRYYNLIETSPRINRHETQKL